MESEVGEGRERKRGGEREREGKRQEREEKRVERRKKRRGGGEERTVSKEVKLIVTNSSQLPPSKPDLT